MSDQTISGSPGSKQQSAGEAQGHCEETEFLHLHVSPQEEGDEEILPRGEREESSRSGSYDEAPAGSCGAAAQGNRLGNLGTGILVVMEVVPRAPRLPAAPGVPTGSGLFCQMQYVCGCTFLL